MILKYYAFLRKLHDGNWEIIEIRPLAGVLNDVLKLEEYDTAFPIAKSALEMYYEIYTARNELIRIKKDFNRKEIQEEDFYFIDMQKIKKRADNLKVGKNKLVEDEDLINEEIFEKTKTEILRKIINEWFPNLNLYNIFSFIEYIDLNNYFISQGYYITDDNKEDIFIEIIEKDDEHMLDKLEKFLSIKQELIDFKMSFSMYFRFKEDFDYMSYWDYDGIDEALDALYMRMNERQNPQLLTSTKEEYKKLIEDVHEAYILYKKKGKLEEETKVQKEEFQKLKDKMKEVFGEFAESNGKIEEYLEKIQIELDNISKEK